MDVDGLDETVIVTYWLVCFMTMIAFRVFVVRDLSVIAGWVVSYHLSL